MLTREIDVARSLALKAGEVILRHYRDGVRVEFKGAGRADPVTQADRDANDLIVAGLAAAFPEDGVLAEESPLSAERHRRRRLWCVDPLDGTQEFIARNGQFAVMIGLAIDGEARLGVVYQPTAGVLCWGAEGRAFTEHEHVTAELAPSRESDPRRARMMVSRSHRSRRVGLVAEHLGIAREEPLGSVGLKVLRIAAGEADLYLSLSTKTQEWDACAPEAIVRAAGGLMTDSRGDPLRYNKEIPNTPFGILATNGPLHAATVDAVRAIVGQLDSAKPTA